MENLPTRPLSRLILLPVNPFRMHAYWELASAASPSPGARPVLRFHESGRRFDVEIDLAAHNWYVDLWSPGKTYYAELGWRTRSGAFTSLARSNEVQTPPAHVVQAKPVPAGPSQAIQTPPIHNLPVPSNQNFAIPPNQNLPIPSIQNLPIPQVSSIPNGADALACKRPPDRATAREVHPLQAFRAEPNETTAEPAPQDLTQYAEERFVAGISSAQDPLSA